MEGTGEGDDLVLLGMTADEMIAARRLDGALDGFRTGIAEEDLVGEGERGEFPGQRFLLGHTVEIGDVPQAAGLLGQGLDQCRMGMAERIDGDAAAEIEQPPAVGRLDPRALAAREGNRRTRKRIVER